jgi:hypothetical protein
MRSSRVWCRSTSIGMRWSHLSTILLHPWCHCHILHELAGQEPTAHLHYLHTLQRCYQTIPRNHQRRTARAAWSMATHPPRQSLMAGNHHFRQYLRALYRLDIRPRAAFWRHLHDRARKLSGHDRPGIHSGGDRFVFMVISACIFLVLSVHCCMSRTMGWGNTAFSF